MNHSKTERHGAILPVRSSDGFNGLMVGRRLDATTTDIIPSLRRNTSDNRSNFAGLARGLKRCDSAVSGNPLPQADLLHGKTQPIGREENFAHGTTTAPTIWHPTGETAPEVAEAGTGSDRRRLRHERGGATTPRPGTAIDRPRADRPVPAPAVRIGSTLRQQALDELLNDLREYRTASPAFRPFWRRCTLHDVVRFKRDHLQPERAAFEAAVARQQARRIAA